VSWHGTAKEREKMKAIIAAEKEEEKLASRPQLQG
jgi:hypothetical protein